jgi:hypothetical protein
VVHACLISCTFPPICGDIEVAHVRSLSVGFKVADLARVPVSASDLPDLPLHTPTSQKYSGRAKNYLLSHYPDISSEGPESAWL